MLILGKECKKMKQKVTILKCTINFLISLNRIHKFDSLLSLLIHATIINPLALNFLNEKNLYI